MKIQFTREELINAIKQIDNNPKLITGRHSSTYDLVHNGNTYPPILVLSTANKLKKGKDLKLEDFGNSTKIPFKILRDNGFEIVSKKIPSMKEQFSSFLYKDNKIGSKKPSAYLRALDLLGVILNNKVKSKLEGFDTIYKIKSVEKIKKIYDFVLSEQNEENGIFQNETPDSYWKSKFYSAALKSYQEFLNEYNNSETPQLNIDNIDRYQANETFSIKSFQLSLHDSGLKYSTLLITRYIASLATKPFVLLSGLSGSGKSKLAEAFAQWICESEEQYAMIPVGADWTNKEPLLGYPNALKNNEYVKPDNPALDILIRAKANPLKPYFLILDEMNLSHVERYFADFLSTMESNNVIDLHSFKDVSGKDNEINNIPSSVSLPKNIFIVGTVNIDETTYMFSPKVLDRANTIEFRLNKEQIDNFLKKVTEIDLKYLKGKGADMAEDFIKIVKGQGEKDEAERKYILKDDDERKKMVLKFFEELQKSGAEFGYRTAFEISKLFYNLKKFGISDEDEQLDIAIMQKMLPKLHGSRTKLSRTLKPLAKLCVKNVGDDFDKKYFNNFENIDFEEDDNIKFKLSFEKIMRMYNNAVENGFASYAEA